MCSTERFSVAPMLDVTDRHARYLYRLLSKKAWLYTEMVVDSSIVYGDVSRFYDEQATHSPVVLQLGGCNPETLAHATDVAQAYGYAEINLNVGCPSDRVQSGQFGAALMAQPSLVAECVNAMQARSQVPITVKTRIGIDDQDSYGFTHRFVQTLVQYTDVAKLVLHARKAILGGLSPRQNRRVPPLDYDRAFRLKADFPHLHLVMNGGLDLASAQVQLQRSELFAQGNGHIDGVMLGRLIMDDPYQLTHVDGIFFDDPVRPPLGRHQVLSAYLDYADQQLQHQVPMRALIQPLFNLWRGAHKGRLWRKALSEHAPHKTHTDLQWVADLALKMPCEQNTQV